MNYSTTKSNLKPKISIGLPVYNGEKFIRKCLDSLLSQTFTDFEVIISDNASTDSTSLICEEYVKKDNRIRYIRQEKNIGMIANFNFVLQKAMYDYFLWMGADDFVLPDFLKKNIEVLLSNENIVGSTSKIERYGITNAESDRIDSAFRNFIKMLRLRFRQRGAYSISGTYEEKISFYLRKSTCQIIYSVFRIEKLRNSVIQRPFVGLDWAEALSVLKYGDFNVIDEVLMYEFEGGAGSKGIIDVSRNYNPGLLGVIFPWYPLTWWCAKNLGIKIFLKNFDYFFRLNFEGLISQIIDLSRLFVQKIIQK